MAGTRALIEAPLSYVDWLLFLPFVWLYVVLVIVPGKKGANRFGADPHDDPEPESQTAGPGNPEPAA